MILLFASLWVHFAGAQDLANDTICTIDTLPTRDSLAFITAAPPPTFQPEVKPNPWRALGELTVACGIIHGLGRYVMKEEFSKSTIKSIRHNLKSGLAWDDDNFYVNYVGHSYQGSLYFNSARSNGHSFWQSVPYTIIGGLAWEFVCENEQPSINDMITTPISGTLWGEIIHRMSDKLIDEREHGPKRFFREAATALINPTEGFHRVVSGRAWKVRHDLGNDYPSTTNQDEILCRFGVGDRCIATSGNFSHRKHQPFLSFYIEYGQAADGESHASFYDYFTIDGALAFARKQHLLSHIHIIGRICSTPAIAKKSVSGEFGLYQFFHYEDTHLPADSTQSPFPFGEMASFGPGFIFKFPTVSPQISIEQQFYAKGVLLGAVNSDYYKFYNRTYNMGSGYGFSSLSRMTWKHLGALQLKAHYMHLFTWKGYEPKELSDYTFDHTNYLNVLGDRSDGRILSINLQTHAILSRQLGVVVGVSYYSRNTHYKYHLSRRAESYEMFAGLEWHL